MKAISWRFKSSCPHQKRNFFTAPQTVDQSNIVLTKHLQLWYNRNRKGRCFRVQKKDKSRFILRLPRLIKRLSGILSVVHTQRLPVHCTAHRLLKEWVGMSLLFDIFDFRVGLHITPLLKTIHFHISTYIAVFISVKETESRKE